MSYILDALRRADAERERERGAVPGLHARPLGTPVPEGPQSASRPQGLWLALGLSLGLLAALAWWSFGRPTPPPPPPPVVQVQVTPVPVQAPAPGLSMPTPTPAPAPAAVLAPTPSPSPSPSPDLAPVAVPAPGPGPGPGTAAAVPTPREPAIRQPAAVPAPAPAPAPLASAPTLPRAVPLAQLAPELRSELPAMTVGGSVYSADPPSRFVIINGQVVREGEGAATGVTVERIGPKSAVLRWREMRVEVPL